MPVTCSAECGNFVFLGKYKNPIFGNFVFLGKYKSLIFGNFVFLGKYKNRKNDGFVK